MTTTVRCRMLGHDFDFRAQGTRMEWQCRRCDDRGAKTYASGAEAARYAAAFDRRGSADLGKRAPLIGLLPLRLWRRWTRGNRGDDGPWGSG